MGAGKKGRKRALFTEGKSSELVRKRLEERGRASRAKHYVHVRASKTYG